MLFGISEMEASIGSRSSSLFAKQQTTQACGFEAIRGGEQAAERDRAQSSPDHLRVKKRDELGISAGGLLMSTHKEEIVKFIEEQRQEGRRVGEILFSLGIQRSTYYRWKKEDVQGSTNSRRVFPLTPEEHKRIEDVKEAHPEYRHRRIQGILQAEGHYLSPSSIYSHLKKLGQVEPYSRREAPWNSPRYEIWQRNLMWGCDWTRLKIGHLRWYLLTVIDFYSRLLIAFDIVPTVNASHVKAVYRMGLKAQGVQLDGNKPELRVDRGSPNTAWVTREFFEIIGSELSFARIRRPTDNAITERFYGSIKQEEIYLVGNYPDERTAREEIGRYIKRYNCDRPHQGLMNFTPEYVHQINNKTALLHELKAMKKAAREKRKSYWEKVDKCSDKAEEIKKNDSLNCLVLSH